MFSSGTGATIIITNKPVVVGAGTREHFHSPGNIVLAVTNNVWGGLQIAGCKFRTDVPYALPAGKYLELGVSYSPSSYFNLNGNDQSIGTLMHNGLNASNVGTCRIWSDEPVVLTVNQTSDYTVYSSIEGAVSLVKAGSAKLTLGLETSTTTGRMVVTEGRLGIAGEGSLGANPAAFVADQLEVDGGMLSITDDLTLNDTNRGLILGPEGGSFEVYPDKTLSLDVSVSGAGDLRKVGSGNLVLSQSNTYLGKTEINNGYLVLTSEDQLGTAPVALSTNHLVLGGGRLRAAATFAIDDANRGISLKSGTWAGFDVDVGQTLTVNNEINGDGYFVKDGDGTLVLAAENIMTGTVRCDAGSLEVIHSLAVQYAVLDFSGAGTIIFNVSAGSDIEVGGLEGEGDLNIGSGKLIVGNQNVTSSFSGDISGNGGLEKVGSGIFTLSGSNTYAGATLVSSGRLMVEKRNALYEADASEWTTTNIIVESGAILGYYVGGDGEFTSADIDTLCNLGSATGGYKSGASIAFNTTNAVGGVFSYGNVIPDPGGNTLGLLKYGVGTLELTADNTYTGPTIMYEGVLSGDRFEDGGVACSIGAAPSTAGNLIFQGGGSSVYRQCYSGYGPNYHLRQRR